MPQYPRDLVGYGRNSLHPQWAKGARLALQFVINYEEGGENCLLHRDVAFEAFLSEIIGAEPLAGARHMNIESMYEYGSRAGFWRLHRLFTGRGIPITVFGVAMALDPNPEAVAAMVEADWEIRRLSLDRLQILWRRLGEGASTKGDRNSYSSYRQSSSRLVHGAQ